MCKHLKLFDIMLRVITVMHQNYQNSEKAIKIWPIFHLQFDAASLVKIDDIVSQNYLGILVDYRIHFQVSDSK